MAIDYDFYKNPPASNKEEEYHIRLVTNQTIHLKDLAQDINRSSSLTPSDLVGAVSALSSLLATKLKEGYSVHIDDIGYFSLSVNGNVELDKNKEPQLKHAEVKDINFRPDITLLKEVRQVQLTRSKHIGRHSTNLTDEEIMERLKTYSQNHSFFTMKSFIEISGLCGTSAYRRMQKLEEQGFVTNIGSKRSAIYQLTHL